MLWRACAAITAPNKATITKNRNNVPFCWKIQTGHLLNNIYKIWTKIKKIDWK